MKRTTDFTDGTDVWKDCLFRGWHPFISEIRVIRGQFLHSAELLHFFLFLVPRREPGNEEESLHRDNVRATEAGWRE